MSSRPSSFIKHKACIFFFALFILILSFSNHARLYKWIDDDGETRYGDQLPLGFENKKHYQLDAEGRIILTKEAGKSPQQLKQERALAEKAAKEKKAAEMASKKQRREDRILLLTFNSESDIFYARDQRLQVLDLKISLLKKNKTLSENKLKYLKQQENDQYISKKIEVPGGFQQKLEEMEKKIDTTNNNIINTQHRRVDVIAGSKKDLSRFRNLKERRRKNTQ